MRVSVLLLFCLSSLVTPVACIPIPAILAAAAALFLKAVAFLKLATLTELIVKTTIFTVIGGLVGNITVKLSNKLLGSETLSVPQAYEAFDPSKEPKLKDYDDDDGSV